MQVRASHDSEIVAQVQRGGKTLSTSDVSPVSAPSTSSTVTSTTTQAYDTDVKASDNLHLALTETSDSGTSQQPTHYEDPTRSKSSDDIDGYKTSHLKSNDFKSTGDEMNNASLNAMRSMETIKDEEYVVVKPKLTIIRREDSFMSSASSHSSASNNSFGKESVSSSGADAREGSGVDAIGDWLEAIVSCRQET